MSGLNREKPNYERRGFPRIKAQCQIHYLTQDGGNWNEAVLEDYSASGICFNSNETLLRDTKLTIQITSDASPTVPALAASAIVLRCDLDEDHRYRVACKLSRTRNENNVKHDYLRR